MIRTETEEGIAHAIVKGTIDFNRDPWPRVSDEAKDLVKGMLDPNPYNRLTVEEVLGKYFYNNINLLDLCIVIRYIANNLSYFQVSNSTFLSMISYLLGNLIM